MTDKNEIILQNLRDFTVQIRRPDNEAIVGTGIAATLDGKIVTCAHVVKAALGVEPCAAGDAAINVYFPQARGDEAKSIRATVSGCFADHDDDVVVLQLDSPPPIAPEQLPKLGTAEPSAFHPFRSYGYRRLAKYQAGHAHGEILDATEPPVGATLHADPVQLESKQINQGMSGAGVLDIERNLVVGVVAEVWKAKADGIDQGTAWGINARVLSLPPLGLLLQDAPQPKQAAAQPQAQYQEVARQLTHARPQSKFHGAPPPLAEWVGRADLLDGLSRDYADPNRRLAGLIGFGGEGKSSLARQWVDLLLPAGGDREGGGLFWWGFYDNQNVDEFFEAALDFISGGLIDPQRIPSSSAKAQVVAAMLTNGRYLFVLDGLEVLQRQEGDRFGLLTSPDLLTFLELFAAPGHESFCLITSRAPMLDLIQYTSYNHRDVGSVTPEDGRSLLRALGVRGADAVLDKLVTAWDGHALTLSLLGTYLKWRHEGNVVGIVDFDIAGAFRETPLHDDMPDTARRRYSHVHSILRRYDDYLTAEERAFMTLFSAFRTPAPLEGLTWVLKGEESADFADDADEKQGVFARLLKGKTKEKDDRESIPPQEGLAGLDEAGLAEVAARLTDYRLLRRDEAAETYTAHPLVRNHYFALLMGSGQAADTHAQMKDYYLTLAGDTPHNPTLEQLAPLIEVVYHACRAGAYDEGWKIWRDRIDNRSSNVLLHQLGAYETALSLSTIFFPNNDLSQIPLITKPKDQSFIINRVGFCHMSLGRLETAVSFYERGNKMDEELEDWRNASSGYNNLADLNANLGRLAASAAAAEQALALARRAANKQNELNSLAKQAWATHLQGEITIAGKAFHIAETLKREVESSVQYLYSDIGIFHAEHLRRVGEAAYARRITAANLEICERNRWPDDLSRSHRVLGELDAADGQTASARAHFDDALTLARNISKRDVLIEALLARGRGAARLPDLTGWQPKVAQNLSGLESFSDLNEALGYATDGGYRIYEADIRIALGWAHRAAGDLPAARREASRAQTVSQGMGYHWGQVDAAEQLAALG